MRTIARIAAALGALTVAVGAVAYRARRDELVERNLDRAEEFARAAATDVESMLASSTEDVRALAALPATKSALTSSAARASVTDVFRAFVEAKRSVFQARIIDARGDEIVRVDRRGASVIAVAPEQLQNKADRYYFKAARALGADQVYVSRLDLNIEHGVIETPPRPVVRVATPLADGTGNIAGIVVINVEAAPIIDALGRKTAGVLGTLMLVDGEGTYLFHPDERRRWGSAAMLGTGAGLAHDDPELARWTASELSATRFSSESTYAVRAPVAALDGKPFLLVAVERARMLAAARPEPPPLFWWLGVAALALSALLFGLWRRGRAELERERAMARSRAATLSETAAILLHEMRNPLAAIVSAASTLGETPALDGDDRRLMDVMRTESARLERTLQQFGEAARPAGTPLGPVDLVLGVEEVVLLARRDPAFGSEIELAHARSPAASLFVHGDADQIRQVLWNLLLNAGEASRGAGGRRVEVRSRSGLIADAAAAIVEIEDDGPGPPALAGDASGPTRGGVGLIVSSGIVARHGGRLDFKAAEKRGTIAVITLPLRRGAAETTR